MPATERASTSVSVTARVPLVTVTVSKSFLALASAMAPPVELAVSVPAVSTPGSVIAAPEESVNVLPERGSVVPPVMAPAAVTLVVPPRAGAFSADPVPTKVTSPVRAVSSIACFVPIVTSGPLTVIESAVILIVPVEVKLPNVTAWPGLLIVRLSSTAIVSGTSAGL